MGTKRAKGRGPTRRTNGPPTWRTRFSWLSSGVWVGAWLCACPQGATTTRPQPTESWAESWFRPALHDGAGVRRPPSCDERAGSNGGSLGASRSDEAQGEAAHPFRDETWRVIERQLDDGTDDVFGGDGEDDREGQSDTAPGWSDDTTSDDSFDDMEVY